MDNSIAKLYQSSKTVFTGKGLALIWRETRPNNLKSKISYYVKRGVLIRLTRGVFAKNNNFDPKELATSLYTPCYISFETVLRETGVIFQHYDTIFVAGPWPKTMTIKNTKLRFRKLKDLLLYNSSGVLHEKNYPIASRERAFLDMLYLFPDYHFDHLESMDWNRCFELVNIYDNLQMINRLKSYKEKYAQ